MIDQRSSSPNLRKTISIGPVFNVWGMVVGFRKLFASFDHNERPRVSPFQAINIYATQALQQITGSLLQTEWRFILQGPRRQVII